MLESTRRDIACEEGDARAVLSRICHNILQCMALHCTLTALYLLVLVQCFRDWPEVPVEGGPLLFRQV